MLYRPQTVSISGESKGTRFDFITRSGEIIYDGWAYISKEYKGTYQAHIKNVLKNKRDSSKNL
jgi:hypothetical protein